MTNLVDRYLLFRIRQHRDPQAFARLYDRYVTAIYRFILFKVPSKEDAEDITSEVFLKLWNYLQEHQDIRQIRALLYRIARNAIADWYRSTSHGQDRSLAVTIQLREPSTDSKADISDAGRGRSIIEARAELSMVMGRLERLKDDYRDVLTLRLIDGLPFALIADIMDRSPGNVRVLYHRAKKVLDAMNEQDIGG